MKSGLTLST